ncbi:MAG: hypothetical protein HWE20_09375 [Gammaproteobacteria bacterium]|nr:hypothetical protein [Gammaproteobacteria bacterium]
MKRFIHIILSLGLLAAGSAQAESGLSARLGYTFLHLETQSSEVSLSGLDNLANLALKEGPIPGSGVAVKGAGRPSVVFNYRFNDHWSAETIVAPPFEFPMEFTGTIRDQPVATTLLGSAPSGIEPFGRELGTVNALPAVVTALYSPKADGVFRPYIGAGVTYIVTFDPKVTNHILNRNGNPKLEVGQGIGFILQVGSSFHLDDNVEINLDFKYGGGVKLSGALKQVSLSSPSVQDIFRSAQAESAGVDITMQAYVFNASVRWKMR